MSLVASRSVAILAMEPSEVQGSSRLAAVLLGACLAVGAVAAWEFARGWRSRRPRRRRPSRRDWVRIREAERLSRARGSWTVDFAALTAIGTPAVSRAVVLPVVAGALHSGPRRRVRVARAGAGLGVAS
ncbi:hypothetical protein FHR81_000960 [Actinoalloteichus hoggarensis]|uniref:Uncharacterized protein n=1 Tax=Actinoalloteichus hoggarensis TaxID=1470176 RepID=A0A221VYW1_9PSEU|nr:hypothetical protein AHOG_05220 [Actinoalloteichus hoggarensis]MBB5919930.1 hypothetical protein [Actinoalloteichus hoggarensis]